MRDRARIEQLLRGATESEIMLLQLRLKECISNPPSFMNLLHEIRAEEDQRAARQTLTPRVRHVRVADDRMDKSSEIKHLQKQIKELQANVQQLAVGEVREQVSAQSNPETRPKSVITKSECRTHLEVQALRDKVASLENQLRERTAAQNALVAPQEHKQSFRQKQSKTRDGSKVSQVGQEVFCYCCGEDAHIATGCPAPEDSA